MQKYDKHTKTGKGKKDKCCNEVTECSTEYDNVCHEKTCEPDCVKNDPEPMCCPCLKPEEICGRYKDAVVDIFSTFILTGTGTTSVTGGTPLALDGRADISLQGNGFLIKGNYIIAPAHLVLLPPSLTASVNRYPFLSNILTLGEMRDAMVRASRIHAAVHNVNGKGRTFYYELELIGVDGAGDVAVLKIYDNSEHNSKNPCVLDCHPYLKFLKNSCAAKCGERVYLLGDHTTNLNGVRRLNSHGITEGLLSDNHYIDQLGYALPEMVLVSAPVYAFSSGLPILDCQGRVLGMQTANVSGVLPYLRIGLLGDHHNQAMGNGFVAGPTTQFMLPVIRKLIRGICNREINCHLESIDDPVGSYYRYRKGYLGIAYEVVTGNEYSYTTDFTSGLPPLGQQRTVLDSEGNFIDKKPECKEVSGIKVIGVAGLNPTDAVGIANGYWYVPGGTGVAPLPTTYIVESPLLGKIQPGDIILSINDTELGNTEHKLSPALKLWTKCKDDLVDICYRKGGNALNTVTNENTPNYDQYFRMRVKLSEYPYLLDYPWYAINVFPLILDSATTPSFTSYGQLLNPQVPQLAAPGSGVFRPAV